MQQQFIFYAQSAFVIIMQRFLGDGKQLENPVALKDVKYNSIKALLNTFANVKYETKTYIMENV